MNVVMLTNTFTPHVGGVARSVDSLAGHLRRAGHRVLVVAPYFDGVRERETDVLRVPAIQDFNGSDFAVRIPLPGLLADVQERIQPHIVHSHHPFLLGATALRLAAALDVPSVFTHHTLYERYTHYVPGDSPAMRRFAIRLATEYANLCDHVIAPSRSIAELVIQRGVQVPVTVIPSGIDPAQFGFGDGAAVRRRYGIPGDAFVVGHVGRLAPEKNLPFLARAVARFAALRPTAYFVVVGEGPSAAAVRDAFAYLDLQDRLIMTGALSGRQLADAYHCFDVFAFASQTETQGMVLAEAMTAGVPAVAVDASGVREVIRDGINGRLLATEDEDSFADALRQVAEASPVVRGSWREASLAVAKDFSLDVCAAKVVEVYESLRGSRPRSKAEPARSAWEQTRRLLEKEWDLWSGRADAAVQTLRESL